MSTSFIGAKGLWKYVGGFLVPKDDTKTVRVSEALVANGAVCVDLIAHVDIDAGCVVYSSHNGEVQKASADAEATARAIGIAVHAILQDESGPIVYSGPVWAYFESGLTLSVGDYVYVATDIYGKVTNAEPILQGEYISRIGQIIDTTGYASTGFARILLDKEKPTLIS